MEDLFLPIALKWILPPGRWNSLRQRFLYSSVHARGFVHCPHGANFRSAQSKTQFSTVRCESLLRGDSERSRAHEQMNTKSAASSCSIVPAAESILAR